MTADVILGGLEPWQMKTIGNGRAAGEGIWQDMKAIVA
jgi:hypothetical protein